MYNKDIDLQVFVLKILSLSIMPPDDIIANWEIIQEEAPVWEEDGDDDHGEG